MDVVHGADVEEAEGAGAAIKCDRLCVRWWADVDGMSGQRHSVEKKMSYF